MTAKTAIRTVSGSTYYAEGPNRAPVTATKAVRTARKAQRVNRKRGRS